MLAQQRQADLLILEPEVLQDLGSQQELVAIYLPTALSLLFPRLAGYQFQWPKDLARTLSTALLPSAHFNRVLGTPLMRALELLLALQ
tara:strand:+ start:1175 stop:1438 length:264 start_codon:yes stop_codon:yes gene_type:complete